MTPLVKRWTPEEIEKLRALAIAGASSIKCAAALNRREGAVKRQARILGLNIAGRRATQQGRRVKIEKAERDLPPGKRRYDGSFVK